MKKALILAAGMGSRLAQAHDRPKPLTDLGGEPSLFRLFRQFSDSGIKEVAVVTGYRGQEIIDFVSSQYKGDLQVKWFQNHKYKLPNGLSVLAARDFIDQRVLLSMADHLFAGSPIPQMAALSVDAPESVLLVDRDIEGVFDLDDATKVQTDSNGLIIDIGKEISDYNAIDTGLFAISPALIDALDTLETPSLSAGVKVLGEHNLMKTIDLKDGIWQDIDTPAALKNALKLIDGNY
ncbi:MAG: NTP transferase domain-containing protein [Myxococcota bacterium]